MTLQDQLQRTLGAAYTVTNELGGGGMSRVFVARDVALNRDVAVKVLPEELAAGVNVDRFRREIQLAAQLQHPNIVPVLSAGETDGLPYYTMPLVSGESLRARLARGPLPVADVIGILREVARALAYAHERGVVHRDIKPDNVLISGGSAVVADFGIAKALSASRTSAPGTTLTQIGTSIGTPAYMAPEQAAGDPATDHRADIYAFGCMAYELLAGRPPFVEKSPHRLLTAHMSERPQLVTTLRPDVPPALADLIARTLEKDPEHRPQSAEEVVRLLDAAVSAPQSAMPPILFGGRGMLWKALALYAVAFVLVAVVAKAAIVGVGLPDWVFPGALIVMALGLPVILFTGYTHYAARRVLTATPTYTPGGTPSSVHGTMATLALRASPHVSWRRTMWGGAAAVSAFVLLIGGYMLLRGLGVGPAGSLFAAGRLTERDQLVVTDFHVAGGDSTLGPVIGEAVRTELGQSSVVNIMPPTAMAGALSRMKRAPTTHVDLALGREIAQREGAKAVIDGDVTPLGAGYIIAVRLVSADSGTTLASFRETADSPKELLPALDKLTHALRGKMGESLKTVHATPPLEQVTTSSLDALRKYAAAVRANNVEGDYEKSIQLNTEAVTIDSTFASAWRSLGIAFRNASRTRAEADSAMAKAYRHRERLTERERLLTVAEFWIGPGRDRAKAAAAFEEMLVRNPRDMTALNNLGLVEASRRNFARAESLYAGAWRESKGAVALGNTVRTELNLGRTAAAESLLAVAQARFHTPVIDMLPIVVLYQRGRLDSIDIRLRVLRGSPSLATRVGALTAMQSMAALRGHLEESNKLSRDLYAESVANRLSGSPVDAALINATNVMVFAEQSARAVAILDSTLQQYPLERLPYAQRHDFGIAAAYALAGRADKARAQMAKFEADVKDTTLRRDAEPDHQSALAFLAMTERHATEAIAAVRKSDQLPDGPSNACAPCTYVALARAFDLGDMPDSAIKALEMYVNAPFAGRMTVDATYLAVANKRLGELYEAKGDTQKAISAYSRFVDLWKTADPALQPKVREVKARLARLGRSTG
ncbi:MAG: protein kinase [Gemmatimonadetes bacterium]|nr:protein kinase [Gemmatimonadota bacterium]